MRVWGVRGRAERGWGGGWFVRAREARDARTHARPSAKTRPHVCMYVWYKYQISEYSDIPVVDDIGGEPRLAGLPLRRHLLAGLSQPALFLLQRVRGGDVLDLLLRGIQLVGGQLRTESSIDQRPTDNLTLCARTHESRAHSPKTWQPQQQSQHQQDLWKHIDRLTMSKVRIAHLPLNQRKTNFKRQASQECRRTLRRHQTVRVWFVLVLGRSKGNVPSASQTWGLRPCRLWASRRVLLVGRLQRAAAAERTCTVTGVTRMHKKWGGGC